MKKINKNLPEKIDKFLGEIDKNKSDSNGIRQNITFESPGRQNEFFLSSISFLKGVCTYLQEIEKTKQIYIISEAIGKKCDTNLNIVREQERTKRLKIIEEHLVEMEKSGYKREKFKKISEIIDEIICSIKYYRAVFEKNDEIFDKIHELNLQLLDLSKKITEME